LLELVEMLELAAGKSLGIQSADIESQDRAGQLRLLHEGMLRIGLRSRRSAPDELQGLVRTFGATLRIRYQPQQLYPDPVRLALADATRLDHEANQRQHHDTLAGWKRWAPNTKCWHCQDDVFKILKTPHKKTFEDC